MSFISSLFRFGSRLCHAAPLLAATPLLLSVRKQKTKDAYKECMRKAQSNVERRQCETLYKFAAAALEEADEDKSQEKKCTLSKDWDCWPGRRGIGRNIPG